MKASTIARLETTVVRVPLGEGRGGSGATEVEVVLVELTDSDGVTGTGFTYALGGGILAVNAIIESLFSDGLIGTVLTDWDRLWFELWSSTHRLGRGVAIAALSAVDIAVWDLRARIANVPLFRLLGAQREAVPIYGSGRATHSMTTAELVDGALSYVGEGFGAVKLRAGALTPEEDVKRVRAVREAVGDGVRVMVDCNERLDLATALWLGKRLEELSVFWLEEPLVADDVAGHATLASQIGIAVAVGEHLQGRFEHVNYLRASAAAVLQPDAPLVGGVSEWLRVATVADAFNVSISPHFLPELHVHLAAAARSCTYVEHFPLIDELLEETLAVDGGVVFPPDRPGHGLLWDRTAIDRFQVTD